MKQFKKIFGVSLITSLILLVFGVILLVKPEATIRVISSLIGFILLIMGATSIVNYFKIQDTIDIVSGIISVIAGLVLILNPAAVASVLPIILGIYFIISGITKTKYALDVKKYNGNNYMSLLVISILMVVCGILLIVNPFGGAIAITQVVGVFIIIYSILDIANYISLKKDVAAIERIFK